MTLLKKPTITEGKIVSAMLLFALPIALSTLLQSLFSMADIVIVRMMADNIAVAAIGATAQIVSLIITSMVGIASGVNVILARFVGAREDERCRRMVSTSLITGLGIGVVCALLCLLLHTPLLRLTDCPEECFAGATTYLVIYALSAPLIMIYNFAATVLRVNGDTTSPSLYLVLSGAANVAVNVILCLLMEDKVAAVAISTALSQLLAATLAMRKLMKLDGPCRFSLRHLCFDFSLCTKIFWYGIPSAVVHAMYPISNLLIQTEINGWGASAIAGSTAASNIFTIPSSVSGSLATATAVFAGQNIGAEQPERVTKSITYGFLLGAGISGALGVLVWIFGTPLSAIFVGSDALAIEISMKKIFYTMLPYFVAALNTVLNNVITTFGYASFTMVKNILTTLVYRLFWMNLIYPLSPGPDLLFFCFTTSWAVDLLIGVAVFLVVLRRYRRGRLKAI